MTEVYSLSRQTQEGLQQMAGKSAPVTKLLVDRIEESRMRRDGKTILLEFRDKAGTTVQLELPYSAADFLGGQILHMASEAFNLQIASGVVPASSRPAAIKEVAGMRTGLDLTAAPTITLEILAKGTNGRPGSPASFALSEDQAREMTRQLQERISEISQRQRPS